jgi:hypothetical protein
MDQTLQNNINKVDEKFTDEVNTLKTNVQNVSQQLNDLGGRVNVIDIVLSGDLRSLVFMPYVYVDGIEAIPYPAIHIDSVLKKYTNEFVFDRGQRQGETIDPQDNNKGAKLKVPAGWDWIDNKNDLVDPQTPYLYLPEIGVDYHMNPATADPAWEDMMGFIQRDTRYTETTTRAIDETDLVSCVPQNYFSGYQHFAKPGAGVLSVGLKLNVADEADVNLVKKTTWFNVNNRANYAAFEASKVAARERLFEKAENYIAALQAKTSIDNAFITSDYAEVYGEDLYRLSISWAKATTDPRNDRIVADATTAGAETTPTEWDQDCEGTFTYVHGQNNANGTQVGAEGANLNGAIFHQVFDNPVDALKASASVYVDYQDAEGVSLGELIQTCFDREGSIGGRQHHAAWKFGEEKKFGFTYEFALVPYEHVYNINNGHNQTNYTGAEVQLDHKYAKLDGDRIIATSKDGGAATETSIGREPLVQVLLKHGDHVIKDGYILCRIIGVQDATTTVPMYKDWTDRLYDNCHGLTFETPLDPLSADGDKCADFNNIILQTLLNNEFDFLTFNGLYDLDGGTEVFDNDKLIREINDVKIYVNDQEPNHDGEPAWFSYKDRSGADKQIARIDLKVLNKNHTNHFNHSTRDNDYSYQFVITMSADQVEALTHDQDSHHKTYDFYIRWTAKSKRAPYMHIYMKLSVNIIRYIEESAIQSKIDNYWYGLDGNNNGWDALAFNVKYPENSTYPTTWSNSTLRSFVDNKVTFTNNVLANGKKFFFIPQNTEITDIEGTTWIITPASGDADYEWKSIRCEKNVQDNKLTMFEENGGKIVVSNTVNKGHDWPLLSTADNFYRVNSTEVSATDTAALHKLMLLCNATFDKDRDNDFDHVFENASLYAVRKADYYNCVIPFDQKYIKIAEMNQATGEITLVRDGNDQAENWTGNDVKCTDARALDMVLNAIGYGANHSNITKELHSWVGFVGANECNVATFTFSNGGDASNKNFGIWTASWQRPINLVNEKAFDETELVKDAQSNGYFISVYDLLSFYDWRGPVEGSMEGNNKWLWAYYNINRITVDTNAEHVTTTLNGGKLGTVAKNFTDGTALKDVTSQLRLAPATADHRAAVLAWNSEKTFATLIGSAKGNAWNSAELNGEFLDYLEGTDNGKKNFGYIFYENNGLNVTEFTLRIPLVIYYEWGHFMTYTDVTVHTTLGY